MCFLQANWTKMHNMLNIPPTNDAKQEQLCHPSFVTHAYDSESYLLSANRLLMSSLSWVSAVEGWGTFELQRAWQHLFYIGFFADTDLIYQLFWPVTDSETIFIQT